MSDYKCNWDRTMFPEDLGIWLARWPKLPRSRYAHQWANRQQRGWLTYKRAYNTAVREMAVLVLTQNTKARRLENGN